MAPAKKHNVKKSDSVSSQTSTKQTLNTKTELVLQSRKHSNSIFDLLEFLQVMNVSLFVCLFCFWGSVTMISTHFLSFFLTYSLKKRMKWFLPSAPVRGCSVSYWREESFMLASCQKKKSFIRVRENTVHMVS